MKKYAVVFPGQGSQSVGMMSALAERFPIVETLYARASAVLGYDLWKVVAEDPLSQLNHTEFTQAALLVAGVACFQIWQAETRQHLLKIMSGHSLGEYTAHVCSGSLEFEAAVRLVADRGRFMQIAVASGKGAMAAIIGLEDAVVAALCKECNGIVTPANYNCPLQVVVAGETEAVLEAMQRASEKGAKLCKLLPVSVPSHCALMRPAATQLAEVLATIDFKMPHIAVINNVDVAIEQDGEKIKNALVRQLYLPVRFTEVILKMQTEVDAIIECGPGNVLQGLCKRINRNLKAISIADAIGIQ